ncbi:MAG: metalloregulator ArsR/SmtB family transcription factor [Bacteroidia bacterium]
MRRDIFQAIADPTRRAILVLITMHAMTPNSIAEHFDISRQAVSKHLKILTECDLLKKEQQEGRSTVQAFSNDNERKMPLMAVRNPDGKQLLFAGNFHGETKKLTVKVGDRYLNVSLPAHSLNTFEVE